MRLRYLLDTHICIYIAKEKPPSVAARFKKLSVGEVGMSVITYGELLYGANKSHHPTQALLVLKDLAALIPPLAMPEQAAKFYGDVRSVLEKTGKLIGNNDLWIAAHALSLDLMVVSNNVKEFSRVKNIKLENWVA
jgi:tRNA(fMet)-specific endonuclease VapC